MKSVTVGIAAYNAERNIVRLLKEVLAQREDDFSVSEVTVHVDAGTDRTADAARSVGDSRIRVVEATERLGFGNSVRRLLGQSTGDVTILLNDDVVLERNDVFARIVEAFRREPSLGLAFGRPAPYPGTTFVERSNFSGWAWFDEIRSALSHRTELEVDGKLMAFSAAFADRVQKAPSLIGNVDMYLYYLADREGVGILTVREAVVRYKSPATVAEHLRWHARNVAAHRVGRYFPGALQTHIPRPLFFRALLRELWRNPFGMLFILAASPLIRHRARAATVEPVWETIAGTKQLS